MVCLDLRAIHVQMSNSRSAIPQPALAWACHRASVRMQAVSDLLLLADDIRPVVSYSTVSYTGHESLAQCREAVISRTQRLLSDSARISERLHAAGVRWTEIAVSVTELSDLVVSLIESSTQTAYLTSSVEPECTPAVPGIVDPYAVSLPHLDIELSCQRLKRSAPSDLAPAVLVQTCEDINRCLTSLTSCCSHASQNASDPNSRDQFKLCVKSFTASASCLLSSVKRFKSDPTDIHHRRCVTFSATLVASTAATVNFATEPTYIGKPASLTSDAKEMKKNIFGACLSVVSSCVQLCRAVRELSYQNTNIALRERVARSTEAISKHASNLLQLLQADDNAVFRLSA